MRIKQITYQHRRDFTADFECEGCCVEIKSGGYDDANFHENVIPNMKCKKCKKCGKSSNDLGVDYRPLKTKYPEGVQL